MANAVFIQNPRSIYKDSPGVRYHFPRRYLGMVRECVGDWVIFYEGRQGALGYVCVQKLASVTPDPDMADHCFARAELGTQWQFERGLISPSGRLSLPDDEKDHPHPDYIRCHRENIFGAAA